MQEQDNQKRLKDLWKQYIPYGIVIAGVIFTGVIYVFSQEFFTEETGFVLETIEMTTLEEGESLLETETYVVVYVCGAVNQPGVYTLFEGSRLLQAVEAAGGFTEDAWQEGINLAQMVTDAEQIYVPNEEDRLSGQISITTGGSDTITQTKVNLNTATKEQLMELPGIGEAKAESIIFYRQEQGAFTCIEDIMNISGIKQSLFDKVKDFITV